MIRVAAFTGGVSVPSARFRVRQYVPALRRLGVRVDEFPARFGSYPPQNKNARPMWAVATLAQRIPGIIRSHAYDVTFLQREMLSTFMTLEPLTAPPRILDVDDAIWLRRGGRFAANIARKSELVICGNQFLADYFSQHNHAVSIIPTAVDTTRFRRRAPRADSNCVIGWTGTASRYADVNTISQALSVILRRYPNVVLRVMADRAPAFNDLPSAQVEFVKWSPDAEVATIQSFDIGIMPLEDNDWNRGKCSYKMLLYMACGVVPVVSPVGMNREVLNMGNFGLGASTIDEWIECLSTLVSRNEDLANMGARATKIANEHFSVDAIVPALLRQFERIHKA